MKKILVFLFVYSFGFGQVSPYFGEQEIYSSKYQYRQITYYDLASVETNFHFLLNDKLRLNEVNSKENFTPDLESGSVEKTYSTSVGSEIYRMKLNFNLVLFGDQHIVKSLTVSGSPYLVTKFYIYAWRTRIQEGDLKKNELVKNYYLQDVISYQFHNGKPIITITNRDFKNLSDFIEYREKSQLDFSKRTIDSKFVKSKYELNKNQNAEEKKVDVLKVEPRKKLDAKSEVYYVDLSSGKIKPAPNEQVLKYITQNLSNSKKGLYSFFIKDINASIIDGNFRLIK